MTSAARLATVLFVVFGVGEVRDSPNIESREFRNAIWHFLCRLSARPMRSQALKTGSPGKTNRAMQFAQGVSESARSNLPAFRLPERGVF
jgi:hypothetical protein